MLKDDSQLTSGYHQVPLSSTYHVPLNFIPGLSKPSQSSRAGRVGSESNVQDLRRNGSYSPKSLVQDVGRNRSYSNILPQQTKRVKGFELNSFVRHNTIDDTTLASYSTPSYSPKIDRYLVGRHVGCSSNTSSPKSCIKDYNYFVFGSGAKNVEINNNSNHEQDKFGTENINNPHSASINTAVAKIRKTDIGENTVRFLEYVEAVGGDNNDSDDIDDNNGMYNENEDDGDDEYEDDDDRDDDTDIPCQNLASIGDLTTSLPDLNADEARKRKRSLAHITRKLSKSSIHISPTKIENNEDRLYLYRVQDELRLKLPKTFLATASIGLMNPICILGGIRRNTIHETGSRRRKTKARYQKSQSVCSALSDQKRGSLGAIFCKIRSPPKSPKVTPPKTPDPVPGQSTRSISPSVFTRAEAYAKQGSLLDRDSNSSVDSFIEAMT